MKNYDLFVLAEQLGANIDNLKGLKGAKFTYCILKNIEIIEKEVKMLMETSKPNENFLAYDKERVNLCEEYCKKDEAGELVKKDNGQGQFQYDIDTESEEWNNAINSLKEKYSTVIFEREEQIKQYNELLDSEADIKLYLIKLDDVPSDISMDLMKIVKQFIKE